MKCIINSSVKIKVGFDSTKHSKSVMIVRNVTVSKEIVSRPTFKIRLTVQLMD